MKKADICRTNQKINIYNQTDTWVDQVCIIRNNDLHFVRKKTTYEEMQIKRETHSQPVVIQICIEKIKNNDKISVEKVSPLTTVQHIIPTANTFEKLQGTLKRKFQTLSLSQ